ncbi:hypothetical protein BBJ28_00002409 [Nothophytophthora sp. Chile5]|nr:hypothetical protein BBJ28_00002409 [Nothophytophthora sp. Chile5]
MSSSAMRSEPNAPLKPVGKVSTPSKTGPALPSRELFPAGGDAATFTLRNVDASSVEQARQLRKSDFEQYKRFHNFFTAREETMAREIDAKYKDKRERIDKWVRDSIGSDVQTCLEQRKETRDALLGLLMVSAALAKHGKPVLDAKDALGEMDDLVSTRFRTYGLRSHEEKKYRDDSRSTNKSNKQVAHTVGLGYVLELVLSLPAEKRVDSEDLKEILNHSDNMRLVLTTTNQGLHKQVDKALMSPSTPGEADEWTQVGRDRLVQIIKVVQSERFQSAMIEAGGDHLYDAIRHRLKQADDSLWEDAKDKPALTHKNIRAREAYAAKVKPKKDAQRRKERHIKEDGTPDRRYRENKALPATAIPAAAASGRETLPPAPTTVKRPSTVRSSEAVEIIHMKKDGTPDLRYRENRVAANNAAATAVKSAVSAASGVHLNMDGTPDMRFKENKAQVESASPPVTSTTQSRPAAVASSTSYSPYASGFATSSGSSSSSGGREMHTGPRGGTFYYTASGNKSYVK